ncbi:MAG: MipA/OmpV family protein [Proteobacteria bacterium]|nr:MipA/OmpV family protein [Pseudomonadota bacterium]
MAVACCFAAQLRAQEVAEIPFFYAEPGTAALGGGIRGGQNPYFPNNSEDLRTKDLIPLYLYEGKYLYAHGTAGGVHIFRNDTFQANLHMRYRFQQLDPGSNAFYEGLEERKQSLDAGLELSLTQKWGKGHPDGSARYARSASG